MQWLRDPEAIYTQSFAIVEREASLERFPVGLRAVVARMIHACGMTDIAENIHWQDDIIAAVTEAIDRRRPIFCDCEMVRVGINHRFLPDDMAPVCTLNDPRTQSIATNRQTTRSAAAVELWTPQLEGAVVIIGNAPTTLFRLLELARTGGPNPAAIIATPVGFVGAAESKQALVDANLTVPFVTVLGRRGGSAIATAALNGMIMQKNRNG